ncbi:HIT family protein [Macrococcus hajekii]|uniref:HIT family protein n=1 Tax=Macrococcus hajekii TaxID=198482 RepID=A0A4R6BMP6_9STAP|nr:HIT family protein [Macrococcus hajekii]TDM03109.1 HIT family protein [Macrococcus hajekii]GGA96033.1 putative histidine triad (HIT) protein [Macrococcus hajekii]
MNHCIFCYDLNDKNVLHETYYFKVVLDIDPIQAGHLLIISKKHHLNFIELDDEELLDLAAIQKRLIKLLEQEMGLGVTVAMNNGIMMDTDVHFHVHVIPRYKGDGFWDYVRLNDKPFDTEKMKWLLKQRLDDEY